MTSEQAVDDVIRGVSESFRRSRSCARDLGNDVISVSLVEYKTQRWLLATIGRKVGNNAAPMLPHQNFRPVVAGNNR